MMTSTRRSLCVIACCMILMLPGACVRGSNGSFCDIYKPVYTGHGDTEDTLKQVEGNNAVWLALCTATPVTPPLQAQ